MPAQSQDHFNLVPWREGQKITFTVPAVLGFWTGALSADGKSLAGAWSQGGSELPLQLAKR